MDLDESQGIPSSLSDAACCSAPASSVLSEHPPCLHAGSTRRLQPPAGVTPRLESPPGAHLQHGWRVLLQHGLHPHKQGSWVRACPAHRQPQATAGRVPRQPGHLPQQGEQEGCSQAGRWSGPLKTLLQDRGGQCSDQHAAATALPGSSLMQLPARCHIKLASLAAGSAEPGELASSKHACKAEEGSLNSTCCTRDGMSTQSWNVNPAAGNCIPAAGPAAGLAAEHACLRQPTKSAAPALLQNKGQRIVGKGSPAYCTTNVCLCSHQFSKCSARLAFLQQGQLGGRCQVNSQDHALK